MDKLAKNSAVFIIDFQHDFAGSEYISVFAKRINLFTSIKWVLKYLSYLIGPIKIIVTFCSIFNYISSGLFQNLYDALPVRSFGAKLL